MLLMLLPSGPIFPLLILKGFLKPAVFSRVSFHGSICAIANKPKEILTILTTFFFLAGVFFPEAFLAGVFLALVAFFLTTFFLGDAALFVLGDFLVIFFLVVVVVVFLAEAFFFVIVFFADQNLSLTFVSDCTAFLVS